MFLKDIVVYFYWLETEFENLKKDQRYTYSFLLFKFQMILIAKRLTASNVVNIVYWVKLPF